ncbi:WecB/TagA/CpsF family glycosyltransferase [Agrobacterium rhizogenes]|uniref:WecB/TagA/CpsF family glycosyltransferase n=1 Tax=Rhizobium TaxID=379 RepID=UPI00026ED6BA|nr:MULTISPECIES: WecB/TagA/CpsF family glycosyltransferase [Rhizobium]OCJ21845.1 N-acetyl mannosamine transferase [Agrobacterium sp. B131/95]OCJ26711.1 N-acetyl mannosamine transferase [Agrobacterium sp. B133/95]EJK80182.1 exopolysaccharide biosynthesis protein, WecB/TagA/CpsF family [Rhizobium sp. AP16]MDJ1633067.1 WecB/TagA/CpsF family glycosyltransferase [Rhizobium rhizogenes]NTG72487.1 WecB/TagA/CpsF family glycosyltransferase [Rhizobium rhizogenes]
MNLVANFAVHASRRMIFDLPVCDLGWEDTLAFINELASHPTGQTVISFVNAHNMLMMLRDDDYRDVLAQNLVLPDGVGLDIASRIAHGDPFPANLNGTDFVPALLTFMDRPKRIGLVGGRRHVIEKAAENFRKHAPWHEFIVIADGFFGEAGNDLVTAEISRRQIDVLIVGMGTPLQEKWVAEHIKPQHARLVMTVGALFDFVSGTVPRAPALVRATRFEWAYRLAQEPGRLWRRYMLGVPLFLYQVVRHQFGRKQRILRAGEPADPLSGGC